MRRPWPFLIAALGFLAGAFLGSAIAGAFGFHVLDTSGGAGATIAALAAGLCGGVGLALARRWSAKLASHGS